MCSSLTSAQPPTDPLCAAVAVNMTRCPQGPTHSTAPETTTGKTEHEQLAITAGRTAD